MLGPVSSADLEISGTGGVLATGTTAADGSFGPLSYDGSYNGPLRIRATGGAGAVRFVLENVTFSLTPAYSERNCLAAGHTAERKFRKKRLAFDDSVADRQAV